MPVSLDQILTSTRGGLPSLRARRATVEREAAAAVQPPSFAGALRRGTAAVIAEVKRRSPSAGSIREDLDPAERAERYARHGAAAISVLTDGPFFGGSMDDLRTAASRTAVPVLRKDFILDELQIVEARAAGAAAILLIVRALEQPRLATLLAAARDAGLDALVEVHTREEVHRALAAGATILGVNSRDLDTFRIDTAAAWTILQAVPATCIAVAESGMASVTDVEAAAAAGADAVLIGTALSAAGDPDALLERLTQVPRHAR
jgi:indole-3-glycerol phosphate synthase